MSHTETPDGNILIVDDQLPNLRLLVSILTEQGYKVRGVPNGATALTAARLAPPDLVLLDINMPEMSGYEVCRQLKAEAVTVDIPVIFISAIDEVVDKVKAFVVGGVDYVTKPFQAEEVLMRVKTHLTLRRLQQQLHGQNVRLEQEIVQRKEAQAELQKANDDLERRVEARTVELKQIAAENVHLYEQQRAQYRRLQESQEQLIQAEKMAALGRLVASVTHEVNNPLQAIQGFVNLLREELEDQCRPEDMHESLSVVEREVARVVELMNRLRDYYRPTQPASVDNFYQPADHKLPRINLLTLLESVLQLAGQQIKQGRVKVERDWDENLPPIQANADHLKQVFLNLLLNALDAMPEEGQTLRLTAGLEEALLNDDHPQPVVRLEVIDTGIGIAPEIQAHLFEPFFTGKKQGTGLGLFTSYNIIESHHGQITVASQVGQGTTFTILLPVVQP
ncbi:MAG: response regulator [Anaerolineae bacterium]|nr:response regulator [Anaerolineae bacterium]